MWLSFCMPDGLFLFKTITFHKNNNISGVIYQGTSLLNFQKKILWPAGLQVFLFGHQNKYSSRQKLYIFILVKLQDSLIQCCPKAKKKKAAGPPSKTRAYQLLFTKGIKACASCVEIIWVSSTEIIWKLRMKAWQREVAVIKSCVFPAYPRRSSGDLYQRVAT